MERVSSLMRRSRATLLWVAGSLLVVAGSVVTYCHGASSEPSTCFGAPGAGALHNGWRLPKSGPNYAVYSLLGWALGRAYVHSAVHPVVLEAYASLQQKLPRRQFLYGEAGFVRGGRFRPHRTHQNGLSVDFMVPVLTKEGEPATIPSSPVNKFGYAIDFDSSGNNEDFSIDFETLALHLAELRTAASRHGIAISRVILAPDLRLHLRHTKAWPQIRTMPFSMRSSWVRHDEHYHVDFKVRCKPLSQAP